MLHRIRLLFLLLAIFTLCSSLSAQEEFITIREEMPEYPGCEEISDKEQRRDCSINKMMTYIDENLHYPKSAKDAELEGQVVISFVVEKDGTLEDITVLRDIGHGCGDAAGAVIEKMNTDHIRWHPGKQNGKIVRVHFNLPIRFKLPAQEAEPEPFFIPANALDDGPAMMNGGQETPPPAPPPVEEKIFITVEKMPRFPGCEDMGGSAQEKQSCAQEELLKYVYENINYPDTAKQNGVEGTVVVSFMVEINGQVSNIKIVRDIGAGCGREAQRVVEKMNTDGLRWIPGTARGRPVSVQFNLPVKFKLQEEIEENK